MKTNKILVSALAFGIAFTSLVSCGDDEESTPTLPPIGGFNSADEVAASDLVAYWPLNGSGVEAKSNTAPNATVGTTWEAGAKGQGAKFTEGYLGYPVIASMASSLSSMTVSLWAKVSNNGGENGAPTMLFSLTRPDDWAGNFNMLAETGWQPATSDSLTIGGSVRIKLADGSVNGQDTRNTIKESAASIAEGNIPNANKNSGKWAHYVLTWDASNANFKMYANGVKISNPNWERRNKDSSGNDQPLALSFFTPTKVILGAFWTNAFGTPDSWQKPMTGNLDEVRVYKKALSATDIGALYELEKAGR